jgi:hypothetical protein
VRRRIASGLALVLLLVAAWWATRPAPVSLLAPVVRVEPAPPPPEPAKPAPARAELPVEEKRPAMEAAIAALAAASGRYAVVCPPLADSDGTGWTHPEGATCGLGGGLTCAASQPAGSVVVVGEDDAPVAVFRWDTGPDGGTTCIVEPPTEGRAEIRVTDPEGAPRAGVTVVIGMRVWATTGADGVATLTVVGTGTHEAIAASDDGAVSRPVDVVAGGAATLVLGEKPADLEPGDVMAEVRVSRSLEAIADLETALESDMPAEVADELGKLLEVQVRGLRVACESSTLPSCRGWEAP